MKKIMVTIAAVALAIGAQAAAVSWSSGSMKLADSTAAGSKVSCSLYIIDNSTYTTLLGNLGADYAKAVASIYSEAGKGTYGGVKASGTTAKGSKTLSDGVDYASGSTVYGLLVYSYNDGTKDLAIANVGKATVETVDQTVGSMGLKLDSTGSALAWSSTTASVPEPTSGLLILLGMAGLALKRKCA